MDIIGHVIQKPPKITKYLTIVFISISLLLWFNIVNPMNLYLNFSLVFGKFQVWRLLTTFFYFGEFNMMTLFHIFIFYQNSKYLEKSVFKECSADYIYFLILLMTLLLILSPLINVEFLSTTLDFAMTYYWGRKCKHLMIQVFGIFTFRAPYYPWFYLYVSYLFGFDLKEKLFGFFVGHVFFYFADIMPRIKGVNGLQIFKTPNIIKVICNKLDLNNEVIIDNEPINMLI